MKRHPTRPVPTPKSVVHADLISHRPAAASAEALRETVSQPSSVLLAVIGMSPAVLTETLWALAHEPDPVIPRRVIVVTTIKGRREIEQQLFTPRPRFGGSSTWDTLRHALSEEGHSLVGHLQFGITADDIRVFTAHDSVSGRSRELEDIRTPSDNEAAADFLLDQVRQVVENPDTHLIASVAGGRKTMGALLYACLTLSGRETDRLTHVLVNEPYEQAPEFFFPGQPGGELPTRGSGNSVSPADARLELADVPFVPLRNLFRRELGHSAGTFSRLVDVCREEIRVRAGRTLRFVADSTRCRLEINGHEVDPSPREHVLMLFLARRAKDQSGGFPDYKNALDPLNAFRADLCASRLASDFSDWRYDPRLRQAFNEEHVRKLVSSLKQKLRQRGGDASLLAACLPEKGRFSLDLEPALIFIK